MTNLIGKTLQNGKYFLEEEIGEGGFGLTYKAINQIINQVVVIKTLNSELQQDPNLAQFTRKFEDEAKRLAKCSHPNIVRVSDFFTEDGLPYIVMEYVPGSTLDAIVLPNKPVPEATAIDYIRQIGSALKVVHQNGLLHRDVKPHNIIQRQGTTQVVLIDFGISRDLANPAHTRIISEGYAPMEQYVYQTKRTPATDIYGLAATLYSLLTGVVPIGASLRNRIALPSPKDICSELSQKVSDAVIRGMELEQDRRPSTVDEWLALLPDVPRTSNSRGGTFAFVPPTHPSSKKGNLPSSSFGKNSKFRKSFLTGLIALAGLIIAVGYAWSRVQPKFSAPKTDLELNNPNTSSPVQSPTPANDGSQPPADSLSPQPVNPTPPADPNTLPPQQPQSPIPPESNPSPVPNTPPPQQPQAPIPPESNPSPVPNTPPPQQPQAPIPPESNPSPVPNTPPPQQPQAPITPPESNPSPVPNTPPPQQPQAPITPPESNPSPVSNSSPPQQPQNSSTDPESDSDQEETEGERGKEKARKIRERIREDAEKVRKKHKKSDD